MEKLTSLPEKWCIRWGSKDRFEIIQGYLEKINPRGWEYVSDIYHKNAIVTFGNYYVGNADHATSGLTEISFEQFEKWVLKLNTNFEILEEESIIIIKKVSNDEGNIFKIGDLVTTVNKESLYSVKGYPILSFRYNKAKDNICAITEPYSTYGIGIDKIEHYIKSEIEVEEETLLEKAKRLYPIGTRYVPVPYSGSNQYVVKYQPEFMNGKNIHVGLGSGYIYYGKSNEWAEIIK